MSTVLTTPQPDPSSDPPPDPDTFVLAAPKWWVGNLGGIVVTGIVARRSGRPGLRLLFRLAVALHAGEAAYTYVAARRAGFTRSAPKWALQTLALGFPSIQALRAAGADVPSPAPVIRP